MGQRERAYERDLGHLESAHVSWVPCILQTVLIALEEEFEEESEIEHKTKREN